MYVLPPIAILVSELTQLPKSASYTTCTINISECLNAINAALYRVRLSCTNIYGPECRAKPTTALQSGSSRDHVPGPMYAGGCIVCLILLSYVSPK